MLLLALALRLAGIHNPILDHPGWRQGDTAAIARNFATLDFNPLHPQTDYDGPPPNYVELELQIVPFLAAALYKIFGVHEVFGRLISIAFSLGTVGVLAYFARWLFDSRTAGLAAAILFAIYPGSTYYGRAFTPDTTMVFFLTASLYASARWIVDGEARSWRGCAVAGGLTALALLAKPVAIVAFIPLAAMVLTAAPGALRRPQVYAFAVLALAPYLAYDRYVASIAEWHWASGITTLHVIPSLRESFGSLAAFHAKFEAFRHALDMLYATMLGPLGCVLAAIALFVPLRPRSYGLLAGWLLGALAYAYVVVTVEAVDYYLYLALPLAALWSGGALAAALERLPRATTARAAAGTALVALFIATVITGRSAVRAYYHYSKPVYRSAKTLDAVLAPGTLVVMGHYDPSILYYINRKGWEEDPLLWTPFDEESAIRKGARYFIAIESRRLERNTELHTWMQRFPILKAGAAWPVYETDDAKVLSGSEQRWRAFRKREKTQTP
ncbi:MAG: ArnT family glycosyltransferase [Vulcanimicrobiaceae bacterium]